MATYDSTVRLRQLNQPELSGYIVQVIGDIPNTGNLTGEFYPLNSNPNKYVTTGQTGNFITQTSLDSNYTNTLVYVGSNYYPLNSNPSGYVSSLNSFLVYSTGNQNISGVKNFDSRPLINGSPILSSGEIYSGVVLLTGNQIISGLKNFSELRSNLIFSEQASFSIVDSDFSDLPVLFISEGASFGLQGLSGALINFYNQGTSNPYITGFDNIFAKNIFKSGYSVIASNQLTGVSGVKIEQSGNFFVISSTGVNSQNLQNVVYTYGNQNISGNKKFLDEVIIADTLDALNLFIVKGQGVFIRDVSDDFYPLYFDNGVEFNLNGKEDTSIKFYDKLITGFNNISATNIYRSGSPVLSFDQLTGGSGIKIQKNNDTIEISTSGIPDFQNVVYTTGNQIIDGVKTFSNQIIIPSLNVPHFLPALTVSPYIVNIRDYTLDKNVFSFDEVDEKLDIFGKDDAAIKFYDKLITGFDKISAKDIEVTGSLYVNGNLVNGSPNIENVVYTTGEQDISGKKNFSGGIGSLYFNAYSGIVNINDSYLNFKPLNFTTGTYFYLTGNSGASVQLYNYSLITGFSGIYSKNISGSNIDGSNIKVNGSKVITGAENTGLGSGIFKEKIDDKLIFRTLKGGIGNQVRVDSNGTLVVDFTGTFNGQVNVTQVVEDAVYTTGDQTIVGTKTFNKNIVANAIGDGAGVNAINSSNTLFLGKNAGNSADASDYSIFIGSGAGYDAGGANNSIFIGNKAGYGDIIDNEANESSILIGNYTSTKDFKNSISIGQGTANTTGRQLNIGNVLYATNIRTGTAPSQIPMFNSGRVGILTADPQYTLDVNGDCRVFGDLWVDDPLNPNDPFNIQVEIDTINAWIEYWQTYWKNWTVSEIKVNNRRLSGALTLTGAGSVSVFTTGNSSTIIISGAPGTSGPGGGSINGAENLAQYGIYARTDVDTLKFKGIQAGQGIGIASFDDYLTISNTSNAITAGANIGNAIIEVFDDNTSTASTLNFRRLKTKNGSSITLDYVDNGNVIEIGGGGSSSSLDCSGVSGCIETGSASGAVVNNIKNFFQDQNNYQFINNYTTYISGTISCDVISGCIATGVASGAVGAMISGALDCSFVSGCLTPSVTINNPPPQPPSPPKINPIRPLFPGESKGTPPASVLDLLWPFFVTLNRVIPFQEENVPIIVENFNLLPAEVQQDIINEHQMVGEELSETIERIIFSNEMPMVTLPDNTQMSGFYIPVLELNSSGFRLGFTGSGDAQIKFFGEKTITGFGGIHADNIYQSGYKVLTTQDLPSIPISEDIVYTTGNQEISGHKTFIDNVTISRTINYGGGSDYGPTLYPAIEINESTFDLLGEGQTAIKLVDKLITGFQGVQSTNLVSNKLITNRIHNRPTNFTSSTYIGEEAGLPFPDESPIESFSNFIGFNAAKLQKGDNEKSNIIGNESAFQANDFNFSNFIGSTAGKESSSCTHSNLIGSQAGRNANELIAVNAIGSEAGAQAQGDGVDLDSNFIGTSAGKKSTICIGSNFIGGFAGNNAVNSSFSNFIGNLAGAAVEFSSNQNSYSNFVGNLAGQNSESCSHSNFLGNEAGQNATGASKSIFIGNRAGKDNTLNNSENDFAILIGNYTSGKKNSIAIGQGVSNNLEGQLNIGNIIYASGLNNGIIPSSNPISSGRVGILIDNPQYTLDVSGTCRISGKAIFGERPEVNGSGVLLVGEGSQGNTSNLNILSEKYGYGAGIYTFSKNITASTSGDIFGVFNKSGVSCQIFDVMINSDYSVAKKYSVVHQQSRPPISYLNVNSGPSGSQDFNVAFFNSGNSGVAMNITNTGTISSKFLVTLFLGGSPSGVEVREL